MALPIEMYCEHVHVSILSATAFLKAKLPA